MVFPVAPGTIANGENASYELGQPSGGTAFTTTSGEGDTQSGMAAIVGNLAFDSTNNRLFVPDPQFNRVLIYPTASSGGPLNGNGENASYVLGETSFTSEAAATTQSGLNNPEGLAYDSTNSLLYVSDDVNNRVMIFNVTPPTIPTPTVVTQGGGDACAIGGGALYCWGYNGNGEDGLGNTTQYKTPQQVGSDTTWTAISQADPTFDPAACGIDNGKLYCWGNNANGEVGNGGTSQQTSPVQIGSDTTWTAISTSGADTCGIDNGALYCWGINTYGEVGNGGTSQQTTPQLVYSTGPTSSLAGWWKLTDGSGTTAADSSGNGHTGTLGGNTNPTWITSGPNGGGLTFASAQGQQVVVPDSASLRLSGSWTVSEWVNPASLPSSGNNTPLLAKDSSGGCTNYGLYIDNGNISAGMGWAVSFNIAGACTTNYYAKYAATPSTGTWYLVTGVYDSVAQTLTLYINGASVASQSVTGHAPDAAGGSNLGLGEEGTNYFNGSFDDARVYNVALTSSQVAQLYSLTWSSVSTGGTDTCGIASGSLYCWGRNLWGEVGNSVASNTVFVTSTTYTGSINGANGIAGATTACAARATAGSLSGTFLPWLATTTASSPLDVFDQSIFPYEEVGGNIIANNWTGLVSGTLLNGGITLNESGVAVTAGDVWTNVASGGGASTNSASSATKNCSGWTNASSPVGTHGGDFGLTGSTTSTWTADTNIACNSTNYLYCFQQNANPTEQNTPVQVGAATNWIAVSQGSYDTCGIRGSSGTGALYCWGENKYGELGQGNTLAYGTPTATGASISTTGWTAITIQYDGSDDGEACGVVSGALYCWGRNHRGEAGQNNTTQSTSPQQVGTDTTWTTVSFGQYDTCGVDNSKLYCWGYNNEGEDGLGTTSENNTPQLVTFNTLNGENATDELGEYTSPSSTSTVVWAQNGANNGPTALGVSPMGIALDTVNHQLFLADQTNSRVLVYALNTDNSIPTASGGHTASYVLGQTSFNSQAAGYFGAPTQSDIGYPQGLVLDTVNGRLFVTDPANNRIMVFATPITGNDPNAIDVLGIANYTTQGAGTCTISTFHDPTDVAYDSVNQNLYVADYQCNRVMIFNVPPGFTAGENASYEFGQTSGGSEFTTGTAHLSAAGLDGPIALAYDSVGSRLFIADQVNNRVMVYSTSTLSDGPNPLAVIGQTSGSGNTCAESQTAMCSPTGVAYDAANARLYVMNAGGNDVLEYSAAPGILPANTASAALVLGATVFTGGPNATTQSNFGNSGNDGYQNPVKYDFASNRLFVGDRDNNRLLIFSTNNPDQLMNGEAASYVLGQANFTSNGANGASGVTNQAGLGLPAGIAYDSTNTQLLCHGAGQQPRIDFQRRHRHHRQRRKRDRRTWRIHHGRGRDRSVDRERREQRPDGAGDEPGDWRGARYRQSLPVRRGHQQQPCAGLCSQHRQYHPHIQRRPYGDLRPRPDQPAGRQSNRQRHGRHERPR